MLHHRLAVLILSEPDAVPFPEPLRRAWLELNTCSVVLYSTRGCLINHQLVALQEGQYSTIRANERTNEPSKCGLTGTGGDGRTGTGYERGCRALAGSLHEDPHSWERATWATHQLDLRNLLLPLADWPSAPSVPDRSENYQAKL